MKEKAVGAVLNEIAHIFKRGEGQRDRDCGGLDFFSLRLEYEQIERQRQQLHNLLRHRRDFHRGGKRVRPARRREKRVYIGREQAHPHTGDA